MQKRDVIMLAGLLGKIKEKKHWEGWFLSDKQFEILQNTAATLNEFLDSFELEAHDMEQLRKAVVRKDYDVCVLSTKEINIRNKEKFVKIPYQDLVSITEKSMLACADCERNKKACDLRRVLKRLGIPEFNPGAKDCCTYKIKV